MARRPPPPEPVDLAAAERFEAVRAAFTAAFEAGSLTGPAKALGPRTMALAGEAADERARAEWVLLAEQLTKPRPPPPPVEIPPDLADLLAGLREQGRHPLVVAARAGDLDAVALLSPQADPDYRTLALEEAVHAGQAAAARMLLAEGAEVTGAALQLAVESPALFSELLATAPNEEALGDALATALLRDVPGAVDALLAAGLPRDQVVASARRLGSDAMRAHLGLAKRRRRN